MYREHTPQVFRTRPIAGLSLCVQGTLQLLHLLLNLKRFIPVCTGNTIIDIGNEEYYSVYPCVYREHALFIILPLKPTGLSLCVQGTPSCDVLALVIFRFIPVCTGNTQVRLPLSNGRTVYPCVYREHSAVGIIIGLIIGLSLCVQGTRVVFAIRLARHRFIPVCTGNTHWFKPFIKAVSGLSLCVQGTLIL